MASESRPDGNMHRAFWYYFSGGTTELLLTQ